MAGRSTSLEELQGLATRYAAEAEHHHAAADLEQQQGKTELAEQAHYRAQMADLWRAKLLAEIDVLDGSEPLPSSVEELQAECRRLRLEVANLRLAVESNRRISVAIGILTARYQMTTQQGFAALRRLSQETHRKLHDVAENVIDLGQLPEPPGGAGGQTPAASASGPPRRRRPD